MSRRLIDILHTRKKKLLDLLQDKELSKRRRAQIEGAINEIDFICMLLEQKRKEPCSVWEKD